MIRVGSTALRTSSGTPSGDFVTRCGKEYYRIRGVERMHPFFMTLVSDSDHWLFLSSNGSLTAGRKDQEHALFPYYTDDKIQDYVGLTGPKTLILASKGSETWLWEPFADRYEGLYDTQRSLLKGILGERVLFEETNRDLGLTFSYEWLTSDQYGFVRQSGVRNDEAAQVRVRILDGICNILPYGVTSLMQNVRSTLVDAYKKSEMEGALGIFSLSSAIVDRPEPGEALKATTVWSLGSTPRLLSTRQLGRFRRGLVLDTETDVRAERGAYFTETIVDLEPSSERSWTIVADVDQGPDSVADLLKALKDPKSLSATLERDTEHTTDNVKRTVAIADGLQVGADRLSTARHTANVLFNVLRGGVFEQGYWLRADDFRDFLCDRNRLVFERHEAFLVALPATLSIDALKAECATRDDSQLERLTSEYLPLALSRRHGDPSRPWNLFSIETRKPDGSRNLHYEGNWRDIFQNWEALAYSYSSYVESMIAVFVNASTADGYNPYRITRRGIDWEVIDSTDPWSHIGYWGDHQIIYLLKLLEISRNYHPRALKELVNHRTYSYANVPYRIRPYEALLRDPHDTIIFDHDLATAIDARVRTIGADGKLMLCRNGDVLLVTLAEKLLLCALVRLSNFIPEAGIWMNTQRPEWNDANNSLAGWGTSVVTLCYLRRYLQFCLDLFEETVTVSREVADLFAGIDGALATRMGLLEGPVSDADRRSALNALASAGSSYRQTVYAHGFAGETARLEPERVHVFFRRALAFVDHSIRSNRRSDGLYHAYNLLEVGDFECISIRRLQPMLEGQVAALSSGCLSSAESLDVLVALRKSRLFRADQHSFLLYPDRQLKRFVNKNIIPSERVEQSPLLDALVRRCNRDLVVKDVHGAYHFNGSFGSAKDVQEALDALSHSEYAASVARERDSVLALFEDIFDHRSFTGRSGTFFGYEGLGCIYWHMVSKLLLAAKELVFQAETDALRQHLAVQYRDIRSGLGLCKTPSEYGAIPTDPYSHTPGHGRAQQPGMTGQVKEDIIARWGELGIVVSEGRLRFCPILLDGAEFLSESTPFVYYDVSATRCQTTLPADTFGFTYCNVPIVHHRSMANRIVVTEQDGVHSVAGLELDTERSQSIFRREGRILRLDVHLSPSIAF